MTPGPGIGSPDTHIGDHANVSAVNSPLEQPKVVRDSRDGLLKFEGVDFPPGKAASIQPEMEHATPLHDVVTKQTLAAQIAELEQSIQKEEVQEKKIVAEPVRMKNKSTQKYQENILIRIFNLPTTLFNYLKQTLGNLIKRGPQQGPVQATGAA